MNTKLNASLRTVVAIASFATITSSPVSAKGRFGGGHASFSGSGLTRPVHEVGSSHNPIPVGSLRNQSIGTSTLLPGPTSGPQPVPYPNSPFRKQIGKGLPFLLSNLNKGEPKHGGPMHGGPGRGWGGRFYGPGFGYVAGYSAGTDYGAIVCGKHLHWSPRFNRCIPNYL